MVQDEASERSNTLCIASDDNKVLRQETKPAFDRLTAI